MNRKLKIKGKIVTYLLYPLILGLFLLIQGSILYCIEDKSGLIVIILASIYIIAVTIMFIVYRPIVMREMVDFALEYAQVQKELLHDLAIPYGIVDIDGNILWDNKELKAILKDCQGKVLFNIFEGITPDDMKFDEKEKKVNIVFNERNYRVELKKINIDNVFNPKKVLDINEKNGDLFAMYLFDETENKMLIKENMEQKLVSGLIYIDNYEEALDSVEDVKKSLLTALIERKINQFGSNIDAIVKKLEKDKYFIAFKYKYLDKLKADKFDILDEVKSVNIGNEMAVTISIGIGVNGETYLQNQDYARIAMDMALGRGGDQAVIKSGDSIYYYGGKSKQVEKNTRVKARVKAHALRELLVTKDEVLIMGHSIPDIDSFGAAVGIYRACKSLNKKPHIVLDAVNSSLRPMVDRFKANAEYEEDFFVTCSQAKERVKDDTVVVVVDVNRPSYTECPELLKICKSIVVLDHHRQTSEIIDNAVLSYIEPFASSACEMVAEILQYIGDGIKIKQVEADAMYGGIMIDTNNFTQKTGVRTFEAAAFLRRNGADVTRIRMMFRNDISDYKARALIVSKAEVFLDKFAISEYTGSGVESPTVICAQAANELLNISGISASFVLTPYNEKVYVSARSIDDINVQLIMEKFGGGGHMNIAGAQIEGYSLEEVKQLIKETVSVMISEGDI